ncbi:MAG: hypothetical protein AABX85_03675 [Nanoarchaeota archaeon]
MIKRLVMSEDIPIYELVKRMAIASYCEDKGMFDRASNLAELKSNTLPIKDRFKHNVYYMTAMFRNFFDESLPQGTREEARDEGFRVLTQHHTFL